MRVHDRQFFILALTMTTSIWANDWPQWGGPDRNFHVDVAGSFENLENSPGLRWQQTLGPGMSGIVGTGKSLYTMFLQPFSNEDLKLQESDREHREVIVALDPSSGAVRWKHDYVVGWRDEQEAFGGRVRSPQATPAMAGDSLITLGFTGVLTCLDLAEGRLRWQKDIVSEFDAPPVQFGYSASPLVIDDRIVILAGGGRGGLVCLSAESGHVLWSVPCGEASYATPILADFAGKTQIIFVTRDDLRGVDPTDGSVLWEYALSEVGLTNVPTPIAVTDGLIISGQGVKGTRKLQIARDGATWTVRAVWRNRTQFFYCNWLLAQNRLIGCDGDLLKVVDAKSGETLGRWRGYADSNLVSLGQTLLILSGQGDLSLLKPRGDFMEITGCFQTVDARCWTPPTWIDGQLYVRGDDQLVCVDWQSDNTNRTLLPRKQSPELQIRVNEAAPQDPVGQIAATFEREGEEAAWQLYQKLRQTVPSSLSFQDRRELARMAESQGLTHRVHLIAEHAVEQFPESPAAREWLAELTNQAPKDKAPSPAVPLTRRGENGLLYLEVLLRNNSFSFIDTYVKGPAKHPFSYGIPFAPGEVRRESWPVGTRLYQTKGGVRTKLLVELKANDAGETLSLFK